MSGKSSFADILLFFLKNTDNISTNQLSNILGDLSGKIDINAPDAFKNLDNATLVRLVEKIELNKIDGLINAIKNSENGSEILENVLKNVDVNSDLGKKIKSAMGDAEVPRSDGVAVQTEQLTQADIVAEVQKASENPNIQAAEKTTGETVNKQVETAVDIMDTNNVPEPDQLRTEKALLEDLANAKSPDDAAKKLQDNKKLWQRILEGDVNSVNSFAKLIGKLAIMGVPLGVGYAIAKHWYKKLNEGKENEILCYATCLPESWDSAEVAGFGGTVELGDSSLGYKYLDNRKQSPQSEKDVLIDENTNKDWDWNTQPLCKKAGKPNCDSFCRTKCGEVHNVELPFEMFSRELGETIGAGVNGLFDGIGLGGLSATVKTLITSIFSIIAIGLIFYMIFVMISKKNNK